MYKRKFVEKESGEVIRGKRKVFFSTTRKDWKKSNENNEFINNIVSKASEIRDSFNDILRNTRIFYRLIFRVKIVALL